MNYNLSGLPAGYEYAGVDQYGLPIFKKIPPLPNEFYFDAAFLGYRWKQGSEIFSKINPKL